ncbi:hypothetical protein ACFQE7_39240 [Nonomuraea ferruginea]
MTQRIRWAATATGTASSMSRVGAIGCAGKSGEKSGSSAIQPARTSTVAAACGKRRVSATKQRISAVVRNVSSRSQPSAAPVPTAPMRIAA